MERLQGSHSDVYALGMLMADLCKLADNHLNNFSRFNHSAPGRDRVRIVSAYYSESLKDLVRRCRSKLGKDRPDAHALYEATKERMEHYRAEAYAAEEDAQKSQQFPGYLFHEKVLFTKTGQDLFRENSVFRGYFLEANLAPVWAAERKYLRKRWIPPGDDFDRTIDTDHHSSSERGRTAPEARVKTNEFSNRTWRLMIEQSINPEMDRFSASYPSHEPTTEDDLSDGSSFLPEEESSTELPVAPPPVPAADKPPNKAKDK